MTQRYRTDGPTRAELDAMPGSTIVEFGTDWCGHCRAARGPIEEALRNFPGVAHMRLEDGPGRPTGRSYRVKLWPTLIFLADGREVARVVRPTEPRVVSRALAELAATKQSDG